MTKYRATFLKRNGHWVGWAEDIPLAVVEGRNLEEARKGLRQAIARLADAPERETLPETGLEIIHEDIDV